MLLQCFSKNDEGSVTRLNNNLYFALTSYSRSDQPFVFKVAAWHCWSFFKYLTLNIHTHSFFETSYTFFYSRTFFTYFCLGLIEFSLFKYRNKL